MLHSPSPCPLPRVALRWRCQWPWGLHVCIIRKKGREGGRKEGREERIRNGAIHSQRLIHTHTHTHTSIHRTSIPRATPTHPPHPKPKTHRRCDSPRDCLAHDTLARKHICAHAYSHIYTHQPTPPKAQTHRLCDSPRDCLAHATLLLPLPPLPPPSPPPPPHPPPILLSPTVLAAWLRADAKGEEEKEGGGLGVGASRKEMAPGGRMRRRTRPRRRERGRTGSGEGAGPGGLLLILGSSICLLCDYVEREGGREGGRSS